MINKICNYCGKEYQTQREQTKYCSRGCADLAKKGVPNTKLDKKIDVVCQVCGKTFKVAPHKVLNTKYCSRDCQNIGFKKDTIIKVCKFCGKSFDPGKHPEQECCSRACGLKLYHQERGTIKVLKSCPICGRDTFNKYCSKECYAQSKIGVPGKKYIQVPTTCAYCGKAMTSFPKYLEKFNRICCSTECMGKLMSETNIKIWQERLKDIKTYEELQALNIPYSTEMLHRVNRTDLLGTCHSKPEEEIAEFLQSLDAPFVRRCRSVIAPLELDFYIPSKNFAIEFNGIYWHSLEAGTPKTYHYTKLKNCREKGVQLMQVWEHLWADPVKKDIIKSIIKLRLGYAPENRIYARQCEVRAVPQIDERNFCEANHIQGYVPSEVCYGLYHNNNLVQLMSFGPRRHKKNTTDQEILRGCPGSNNLVVGGVSKLMQHYVRNDLGNRNLISFCDLNLFSGASYTASGMELASEKIQCFWINAKGKVINWLFRNKEKREAENKYTIWTAGNALYIYKKNLDI